MITDSKGKQESRRLFAAFCRRVLGSAAKRAKVLCLPGADCLELPIYRRLGILDSNIVAVERDLNAHFEIQEKAPGIDCRFGLVDWFCKFAASDQFSIVNLDYCGILSKDKFEPIRWLLERKLVKLPCVIAMTFFVGRDEVGGDIWRYWAQVPKSYRFPIEGRATLANVRSTLGAAWPIKLLLESLVDLRTYITDVERYAYRNGSDNSMMVDFVALGKNDRSFFAPDTWPKRIHIGGSTMTKRKPQLHWPTKKQDPFFIRDQVWLMTQQGRSAAEIAKHLRISVRSVAAYKANITRGF